MYFPGAGQAFDSNLTVQSIRLGFNYGIGGKGIDPEVFTKGISALDLDWFVLHAQTTFASQYAPPFHAPYHGQNSLDPNHGRETWDVTFYAGLRLWQGAEIWVNPEIDQGFGLSSTLGVAGFTSGEAYKVGFSVPYARIPRMFLRQTIDLGGDSKEGRIRHQPVCGLADGQSVGGHNRQVRRHATSSIPTNTPTIRAGWTS